MQYWSQEGPKVPFTRWDFIFDTDLPYEGDEGGGGWDGQWLLTITNIHIFNDLHLNFPTGLIFFLHIWALGERVHLGANPSQNRVRVGERPGGAAQEPWHLAAGCTPRGSLPCGVRRRSPEHGGVSKGVSCTGPGKLPTLH